MKKVIAFTFLFLLCFSCNSIKVKETPIWDLTQPLCGKIEKIEMTNYRFETSNLKSDTLKESGVIVFDNNNNIVEQNEIAGKYSSATSYQKKNGLINSRTTVRGNIVIKEEMIYDKKGNILKKEEYNNDILYTSINYKYDSKGNTTEAIYYHPTWKSDQKKQKIDLTITNQDIILAQKIMIQIITNSILIKMVLLLNMKALIKTTFL